MKSQNLPQSNGKGRSYLAARVQPSTTTEDTTPRIWYPNTPEGMLGKGDHEALRRFVLMSSDLAEQSQRQSALFEHASSGLAMWNGYTPAGSQPQNSAVVRARLVGWPFLICSDVAASVQTHFDWRNKASRGLQLRMTEAFASALETHPRNICVLGAVHGRSIAGVSPLKVHSLFRRVTRKEAPVTQSAREAKHIQAPPLAGLISDGHAPTQQIGKYAPQAFVLTAVVASDWARPYFERISTSNCDSNPMKKLLAASLSYPKMNRDNLEIEGIPVIQPEVYSGSIQRFDEAITEGQGMELAWFAQLARRRGLQFQASVERTGTFLQWRASLSDGEGEELASSSNYYDDQWRPQEHIQMIFDRMELARATGALQVHFPLPYC